MKKEKVEITNLNYEYPKKTKQKYPKEKLYFEKTVTLKPIFELKATQSNNEKIILITKYLNNELPKIDKLIRDYLLLKMYKYIAKRDEYYNKDVFTIEKLLNRLKKDYLDTSKDMSLLKQKEFVSKEEIDIIYDKTLFLIDFVEGLQKDILNFQKKYYKEFKMLYYFTIQDKTNQEIEKIILKIDEEVKKFKNIKEASDYYIFNSGKEITDLINEILYVNKYGVKLDYHYFIKNDAIISFSYPEWLELMSKFQYVFSKLKNKVALTTKFNELYSVIEIRFLIILIAKEL